LREDMTEVLGGCSRDVRQAQPIGDGDRRAERALRAVEIAELCEDEAEVQAARAGVASIARALERSDRDLEELAARAEITGDDGAERAHLVERGVFVRGGGASDVREQRVRRAEAPARGQEPRADAEAS